MHAFLLETSQKPQQLDLKSIIPQSFETVIFYEIQTIAEVREFKKSWLFSQPQKTLCVISNIDDAKEEAQNALLKILEEPPHENLIFLILVKNASSIIQTILSRVSVIRINREKKINTDSREITFSSISKITDRDDAIALLENIQSEAAIKAVEALKRNGNVSLHLTNFIVNNTP